MKITENITKKIWKDIIKLQYQKGSITDICLYKNKEIKEKELATILQKLKSLDLLEYVNTTEKNYTYYVKIPKELSTSILQKGVYVNKTNLDGGILREFLNTAIPQINKLTLRSTPLGIETPPSLDIILFREKQELELILNNLNSKITVHTLRTERQDEPDSDRDEISYTYEKENKKKVKFIISTSNTWLKIQNLEGANLKLIEKYFTKIVEDYVYKNDFSLGYSVYKLKCVCSGDNISEDCIQISNVEDLRKFKIKDLILEKYV